jgi:predicted secreted protein with PEFG-CTERM motif
MKTKTISSLIVLLAITSMAVTVPSAFADHAKVTVEPTEGSGNPSDPCVPEDPTVLSSCYSPSIAVVDVGGEVVFSNTDMMPHSFTYGADLTSEDVGSVFDSGLLMQYQESTWSPDTAGEYNYFCMVHPWMTGLIQVQAAAAAEETPEETHEEVHTEHDSTGMGEMDTTLTAADIIISVDDGAQKDEMVVIDVTIGDSHVTYDIVATHNGQTILNEIGAHSHTGEGTHTTSALSADASDANPIDVTVTFQGFGAPTAEKTGPIGLTNTAQAVPEFGTIAAMILVVAIVSIIAITSKSRLSLTPRL